MSALRIQMQADMAVRGLAPRTQKAYIDAVASIARHYHRSPDTLSIAEIEQYLHYLITERQRSWSTTNQAVCALRFLFHVTLQRPEVALRIPTRRAGSKQPEILSREEVGCILNAARQPMHRTFLMTAYAAGLRVSEACHVRCADIDAQRAMIRVVSGKGSKDRYTLLSAPLLAQLRLYWKVARPASWLFPKPSRPDQPLDICTAQRIFYRCKRYAGVAKQGGIHSLRHAFATHLLESGVDLHTICRLLGHSDISTTTRYLHLKQADLTQSGSPLDLLEQVGIAAR